MRIQLATFAAALALAVTGVAHAQSDANRAQIAFEIPGEAVKPTGMTQAQNPNATIAPTYHYRNCYNYYRWYYNYYYGWQRYFVGTRCY